MAVEKEKKYGAPPRQLYNDGKGMVYEEYEFQAITPGVERLLDPPAFDDVFERLLTRISDCRDRLALRDIRVSKNKKALSAALAKMDRPPQFKIRDAIKFVLLREWGAEVAAPVADEAESFGPPPVAESAIDDEARKERRRAAARESMARKRAKDKEQ